jgi:ATP-grasp domain
VVNQGQVPRVLLTDTDRRAYAARLAVELSNAGCAVSTISTYGHPILKTRAIRKTYSYSALRPLESLLSAIDDSRPDIVVPCCDRSVQHLHQLHARVRQQGSDGRELADLIERSLGAPEGFSIVSARYDLLRVAQEEALLVPDTCLVNTLDDLRRWGAEHPFPWVLKSDGTWGGRGVRIAHTLPQAEEHFSTIKRPSGLGRAIKRLCVNRDPFFLRPWWSGLTPSVIVQTHIHGRPANCAVVCFEGRVLAGIGVEVVGADGETGPASIVRVVDSPEMMRCAERIARRLRLSGFFGLDFMIETGSTAPYLIEMNPRCTPLCHLRLGKGRDLVAAIWSHLTGQPLVEAQPITENDMIAYFPQAWIANSEFLESSFQDVPQGEPELVKEFLRPWPERSFLFRLTNHVQQVTNFATAIFTGTPSDYRETRT